MTTTVTATSPAPEYRERAPAGPLASRVACLWTGRLAGDGTPFVDAVLPDGCIDVVWDGEGLFVAGPDTGPVAIARMPGATLVGLRFRPAAAPGLLGVPASALTDQRVDAAELLGARTRALVARLAAAGSPRDASRLLEAAVLRALPSAAAPDRLVQAAARWLAEPAGPHPVAHLAARLGVSERQLHRRCVAAVGYGPKTLHRVLRFRRWLGLAERAPGATLAELAVAAGYADQAHLTRDTNALAGATPARLRATWVTAGG